LDQAHRKRNVAEYEGELDINEGLLESLIRITEPIAERVIEISPRHPSWHSFKKLIVGAPVLSS
jgi:hypothetical protein